MKLFGNFKEFITIQMVVFQKEQARRNEPVNKSK